MAQNRNAKSVGSESTSNSDTILLKASASTQSPETVVKHISETRDNINLMNGILRENQAGSALAKLSPADVERTKQMLQKDITQYNNDIQLLSLLVGRPVSSKDISELATTNLGRASVRSVPALSSLPATRATTTTTTTVRSTTRTTSAPPSTSSIPAFKPLTDDETKFLQALEQIQTTKTTTTTTERIKPISLSQEAVIAAILKQQGIGPNNQIPIEVT